MFLSVIIPCRNERAHLVRCLDSILASDYTADQMEVIVADGMSDDGTRELITDYSARDARVRMIDNPRRITPCALNLAIAASRGEIIARVDAHAVIAPDYLSRCVHYLATTDASNVGGSMRTLVQTAGPFSHAIIAAISHRFGVGNSYFRIGSQQARWVDTVFGGCWRREVVDRVGMFNERLERSQDIEFSMRLKAAGGKTLLAPDIRSDYYARSDLASFWHHNFLNGQWAVLPFLYSDVIPVSLRHLVPLIFIGSLVIAAAMLPWTIVPTALVAIPYAIVNSFASIHVSIHATCRGRRALFLFQMPFVFASLHIAYGLGSLTALWKVIRAKTDASTAPHDEARDDPRDDPRLDSRVKETPWLRQP
jgi:succinoglycan biosynthesis protein ExoA